MSWLAVDGDDFSEWIYEVLQDRDRWLHYVPKRAATQEVSPSDVLGVFNYLFIAKAVKTNRYGVVGY